MNVSFDSQKLSTLLTKGFSIFYISFIVFTILHFIVPFSYESGSIPNARFFYSIQNSIDLGYQEPINVYFFDYVYLAGHYSCHQLSERSFFLNDNQIPVCSRCLGIYLGMSLVFFIALWRHPSGSFFQSLCRLIKSNNNLKSIFCDTVIIVILGAIFAIPMLADGFLQIFTSYLSNNFTRLITGFLFGLFEGGCIIGILSHFANMWKKHG